MKEWLKEEIVDKIDEWVDEVEGGTCQNASERAGKVALGYRDKDGTPLGPTHYICSTGLAIAHCNSTVINAFRATLLEDNMVDQKIEAFGNFQTRLHELIGLPTSEEQRKQWACLLYTSPSPRDRTRSRMPSSA